MDLNSVTKNGRFDLHVHTTASDGVYSPYEVVKKARDAGLQVVAITDHDTLAGIEEAKIAGIQLGMEIIAGIEITTHYKGKTIDILGYGINLNQHLHDKLSQMEKERNSRALKIIARFNRLGMPITLDEVKKHSKGNIIARPHIAMAIVQKGYVRTIQEVFDQYLGDGKPCSVDKLILTPEEGIQLIHRSSGQAVMAHPKIIGDNQLVSELLELPFDGIEVWHRKHAAEDVRRYHELASQLGLIMTGGSDFHRDGDNIGQFGYPETKIG